MEDVKSEAESREGEVAGVVPWRLRAAVRRANRPGFFFVNIGANDGVSNDYVYPFLCEYGWRGLAVEPLDERFAALARNYARFPRVILERAAISATPRALHFLAPTPAYDRPWIQQVGSLDRALLLKTIEGMRAWEMDGPVPADIERAIVSVDVPCLSFAALMEKHHVEAIDFLSIDAEGSDYEIFCSIDCARYRPRILVIETGNMTAAQRSDFDARLVRLGLAFLTRLDFLTEAFVERELLPPWPRLRLEIARACRRLRDLASI
ncbi:FkbM family methyltransferase [Candidatus Binatia bacterium]|nr:FkbM family methyltransferase [Candidatus Binatia bacterium]